MSPLMSSAASNRGRSQDRDEKTSSQGLVALAVCGDPVVSRALVLLLQDSRYDVRYLSTSSLSETGSLEDFRLLLLVPLPELNPERRRSLSASLRDTSGTAEVQVLELVTPSRETQEGEARGALWHTIPWPCKIEELKQRIEAVLQYYSRS